MRRIGVALHDLCQPITTLQCRLELAGIVQTPEADREAVQMGLLECTRVLDAVNSLRDAVRAASRRAAEEEGCSSGHPR